MFCFGCDMFDRDFDLHVLYRDEYVTCILDNDPNNYGQALVLPVDHFKEFDDMDSYTLNAVNNTLYVVAEALKIVFNTGNIETCYNSGDLNGMGHCHLRVIPRFDVTEQIELCDLKDKVIRVFGNRD